MVSAINSAINNAVSGLNAASTRISASADNIANQFTPGFKPEKVTQTPQANGGVQANVSNASQTGVDTASELVNTSVASYDYQANLKTIKVAQDTTQSLLNIIS